MKIYQQEKSNMNKFRKEFDRRKGQKPGQGQIVAGSLADYLKRHPEIDRRVGKDSRRSYLTTEKTELFDRMAGLFLKEEISSQRIFMC